MAQLAEWSLPIPDVCGSNPVNGKKNQWTFLLLTVEKTKMKKKEDGNDTLKKVVGTLPR